MFYPEVKLLHATLAVTVVVVINKVLGTLIYRYKAVEKALDRQTGEVIRDCVIVIDTLREHKIGKSELFESLRKQGCTNLGEVRQAYLETSGRFSLFRAKSGRAGLTIEPPRTFVRPGCMTPERRSAKMPRLPAATVERLSKAMPKPPPLASIAVAQLGHSPYFPTARAGRSLSKLRPAGRWRIGVTKASGPELIMA